MKRKVIRWLVRGHWAHLLIGTSGILFIYGFLRLFLVVTNGLPTFHFSYRGRQLFEEQTAPQVAKAFYWKHNGPSRTVQPYDCRRLLEGEPDDVKSAIQYTRNHPRKPVSSSMFIDLVSDCKEFKTKRGYITNPMSQMEEDYPIAFSILFYQDIEQVERLLRAIYHPQNVYCLHLDAYSSDVLLLAAKALVRCFDNVFLASKLEKIVYAGYSRLKADINCMGDALRKHRYWKYYINLASQDFPLKTNYEMVRILKIYNGSNDIEGIDGSRLLRGRYTHRFELATKKPRSKPSLRKTDITKNNPPHGIKIVRGSAYGVFSREFVKFIIQDRRSRDLLQWSKDTYSPDEHFWATLHHLKNNPGLKTPGGYTGEPNNKPWNAVYASWGRRDIDPCLSGHFVHGVCIFGVADLPQLISRKEFFANKFHFNYQYLALDCLEEWLYNRTLNPPLFDSYYYRRLPFINGPILEQPTRRPRVKKMSYVKKIKSESKPPKKNS